MSKPIGPTFSPGDLVLATDLYEFTMAAGYLAAGRNDEASFELFVRSLPPDRGFLLACGLEQALYGVLNLGFSDGALQYLRSISMLRHLPEDFFSVLRGMRFEGEVWAVPEGTVVFESEPLLRVRAPLPQAQILETYLLAQMNYATLVATKAARVVLAAEGRPVVDFGSRRAHGTEAGVLAARAAYVAGCAGTSNVLAGRLFGVPVFGTAAHSWTMAWPSEEEAFARFREVFPDAVLLVDTYDTLSGTRRAAATGPNLRGVRLDSGDLATLSHRVRAILNESGQRGARIFASGDLNEHRIASLLADGADIDAFGVGTHLVTSHDYPSLNAVYKLVEVAGRPTAKASEGKATFPGPKQVFRRLDRRGRFVGDELGRDGEPQKGHPLLECWVRAGEPVRETPGLEEIRRHATEQLSRLPDGVKRLRDPQRYPVEPSSALRKLQREVLSSPG